MRILLFVALFLVSHVTFGRGSGFTGEWNIDLRTPSEIKQKAECGMATFTLKQTGKAIGGSHSFATVNCGRVNEGVEGTVKGTIVGPGEAILVVTSGRNGGVVFGKATLLKHNRLLWETIEDVKEGEPQGDSPLILSKGILRRHQ
jgi:hypothetical protein